MKTVAEIFASKSKTVTARTVSSILSPAAPASSNQRVNEILGITQPESVRAGAPVGNQNAAGKHVGYSNAKASAESSSKEAHESTAKISGEGTSNEHHIAGNLHSEAAFDHRGAAFTSQDDKTMKEHLESAKEHDQKAQSHYEKASAISGKVLPKYPSPSKASDSTPESDAVTARATGDVVHCRAASDILGNITASEKPWKQGEETRLEWMPSGQHTICAGFRNASILLTVDIDQERDTPVVNASFQKLVSKYPKQKPFGCIEHEEKDASVWAKGFEPSPTGINLIAEPSALGENHVNGRIHRSWSPSFLTDADYTKATLKEYPSGKVYEFPAGVRGSETNPARITGVTFCVGTLTNNPAFKEINPVRAKEMAITMSEPITAGAPRGNRNAAGKHEMHATQTLYAVAKAQHDVIHEQVQKEKASMPPYPHEGTESEKLEHAGKEIAIEDKHGYWPAKDTLRKAEDAMIDASQEHMKRQPVYQKQDDETKKNLDYAIEKGKKSYTHRPKLVDIAFRLNHSDGVQATAATPQPDAVRATWSDAAREAAALARKSGMHAEAHRLSAHANSLTAAIGDKATKQQHGDAAAAHEKAYQAHSDLHVLHGENKEHADHHDKMRAGHEAAYATATDHVAATARTVTSILGEPSRLDAVLAAKTATQKETKNISGVTRTASTILASVGKATSAHSQKTT